MAVFPAAGGRTARVSVRSAARMASRWPSPSTAPSPSTRSVAVSTASARSAGAGPHGPSTAGRESSVTASGWARSTRPKRPVHTAERHGCDRPGAGYARVVTVQRVDPHGPGIGRRRRGRGFSYPALASGEPLRDPEALDRIEALVVPPAWQDVWICPLPDGHIQAGGTDAAGRA